MDTLVEAVLLQQPEPEVPATTITSLAIKEEKKDKKVYVCLTVAKPKFIHVLILSMETAEIKLNVTKEVLLNLLLSVFGG